MNPPAARATRWPLWLQLLLALSATVLVVGMVMTWLLNTLGTEILTNRIEEGTEQSMDLMAVGVASDMKYSNPDIPRLRNFVDGAFRRDEDIFKVQMFDRFGKKILEETRPDVEQSVESYLLRRDIRQGGEHFGSLTVEWDLHRLLSRMSNRLQKTILLVTGLLALLLGAFWLWMKKLVINPTRRINQHLNLLTEGDLDTELKMHAAAEFERMGGTVNSLQDAMKIVHKRESELQAAKAHLSATNENLMLEVETRKKTEVELKKARDEALDVSRMKSEFLANMSHELRTPLNAVLGMSEALQEDVYGELPDTTEKPLQQIHDSGNHLLELINDILDLSKIEANQFTIEPERVDVQTLGRECLQYVANSAQKKQITLSLSTDQAVYNFQADPRRLKQVLINLMSNAVKFTPEGGKVDLKIRGRLREGFVDFIVSDTGIGVEEKDQDKLFESFVQIQSDLSRHQEGSGLGLSLVKNMTEQHGGHVSVQSEVGVGSTFTASFPWDPKATSDKVEVFTPIPLKDRAAKFTKALNIEDSQVAAEQISRYLDELGIENVVHPTGNGAVDKAVEVQPDVIVLDIILPDQSGWSVLEELQNNPRTCDIPVIVVSVTDDRGRHPGVSAQLVKPITREQLQHALQMVRPGDEETAIKSALSLVDDIKNRPDQATDTNQGTILLVEDNEANINTICGYLDAKDYHVILATNGQEALNKLQMVTPNLVIMDIQMPVMNGFEAMQHIRNNSAWSDLPIIALTALAMKGDERACIAAGANAYLAKPVKLKELGAMIRNFLKQD